MVSISTDATGSTRFFAIHARSPSPLLPFHSVCSYFLMHTLPIDGDDPSKRFFCPNINIRAHGRRIYTHLSMGRGYFTFHVCAHHYTAIEKMPPCACALIRGVVSLCAAVAKTTCVAFHETPMRRKKKRTPFKCPRLTRKCFNDACEMAISDVSFPSAGLLEQHSGHLNECIYTFKYWKQVYKDFIPILS